MGPADKTSTKSVLCSDNSRYMMMFWEIGFKIPGLLTMSVLTRGDERNLYVRATDYPIFAARKMFNRERVAATIYIEAPWEVLRVQLVGMSRMSD